MSLPGCTGKQQVLKSSIMNPTEAEVHLASSRANSVLLHWILFDANLSLEGAVS